MSSIVFIFDVVSSHLVAMDLTPVGFPIFTPYEEVVRIIIWELHTSHVDFILSFTPHSSILVLQVHHFVRSIQHLLIPDTESAVITNGTDVVGFLGTDHIYAEDGVGVTFGRHLGTLHWLLFGSQVPDHDLSISQSTNYLLSSIGMETNTY